MLAKMLLPSLLVAATGFAAFASPASAPASQGAESHRPHRIVSVNLCSDQLLLALGDRDQIAALSSNAAKPEMSAGAARTKGLRILSGSAEEVLALDPDLIIGTTKRRAPVLRGLKANSFRTLDVPPAESYAEIAGSIRMVAAGIGQAPRGEALIARMDRELAGLAKVPNAGVAAYYQRRGFMTGTGTLVDELMRRVGLVNLAGRLGKSALAQVSLEEMVAAEPDYLIVESATDRVTDLGTEMLHHPALAGMKRISIPQAWTVCGGPAYVLAARAMVAQMGRQRLSVN